MEFFQRMNYFAQFCMVVRVSGSPQAHGAPYLTSTDSLLAFSGPTGHWQAQLRARDGLPGSLGLIKQLLTLPPRNPLFDS